MDGRFFLPVFLLLFPAIACAGVRKPPQPDFDVRHYKIELELDAKTLRYSGQVTVHFRSLVEKLEEISLHDKEGIRRLHLPLPLREGESISVTLQTEGKADERNQLGLFAVRPDPEGLPQFFTQFESLGARKVFPCFDEPFDKATTEVILTADARYTLLSNGRKISEEKLPGGRRRVHFKNSDPISTYHISLVAAELVRLEGNYKSRFGKKIPLAIYTQKGSKQDVRYAMGVLKKALAFYEDYFGSAYPWESYGIVALPGFTWGGMENKGLANLNAARLLWNKKTHPVYKKAQIAGLVAHELAHEWFGNWVTMAWWDDLWLNEAFATFMTMKFEESLFGKDYVAIDNIRWLYTDYFPQDAGPLSHPIVPQNVDTVDELFDAITYAKGVQVVRMLEDWIGPEAFQNGIRDYFETHRLGNATTADFFAAMEKASGADLSGFARGWLRRKGYPELVLDGKWDEEKKEYRLWVFQKNAPFEFVLEAAGLPLRIRKREENFVLKLPRETKYIPVNQEGRALMRYEWKRPWKKPDWERVALEGSPYAEVEAFHHGLLLGLDVRTLFPIAVDRFRQDDKALRWGISWAATDNRLSEETRKGLGFNLHERAIELLRELDPADPVEAQTREQLLILIGQADDPRSYAFLKQMAGSRSVDDRMGALAGLLRTSDPERDAIFEKELRRFTGVHHYKLALLQTLAVTPRPDIPEKVNRYLLDETLVGKDDSTIPIRVWRAIHSENKGVIYTPEGVREVARFVAANLDRELVAGQALRALEGAGRATAALKGEIRVAIRDLLKKSESDYIRSIGRKILAAAQ